MRANTLTKQSLTCKGLRTMNPNPINRTRFTRQSILEHTYMQFPRFLQAINLEGKKLTCEARVLYTLLFDRNRLSVMNGWFDENNEVYIYFKREEMEKELGISERTVKKVVQELINHCLLEEKKQGFNKPNKIYLLSPIIDSSDSSESEEPYLDPITNYNSETENIEGTDTTELRLLNHNIYVSDIGKNYDPTAVNFVSSQTVNPTAIDTQNLRPNKNYINKNQINKNEFNKNEGNKNEENKTAAMAVEVAAANPKTDAPVFHILKMYNALCNKKSLRPIKFINGKRKQEVTERLKEYNINSFVLLFQKVEQSLFLCGGGDRGWKADFDWLISQNNMQKVLEGKYDNSESNKPIDVLANSFSEHSQTSNRESFNTMDALSEIIADSQTGGFNYDE